jgi:ankyrin repeat protein
MIYRNFGKPSELVAAIVRHDAAGVERLLAAGADPNARDEEGWRPLHVAVAHAQGPAGLAVLRVLVERGADVNATDANGKEAPIATACDPPNPAAARLLLEAGADPEVNRADGETPLLLAAASRHVELAELLLRHGATKTMDEPGGVLWWSPLTHAVDNFDVPMIELLIRAGADPAAPGENGETARDYMPPREQHDPQKWDRVMEMLGRRKP